MSRLSTDAFARVCSALQARVRRHRNTHCVRVYIAHDAVVLCRVRGLLRPAVLEKTVLQLPSPEDARRKISQITEALAAWSRSQPQVGTVEWIIGLEHVRYVLLPWDERLADGAFCLSLARVMFTQQASEDDTRLATSEIRFAPLIYGRPRLAALIAGEIIQALTAFASEQRWATKSITPALAVVWDEYYGHFRKRPEGTLAIVEGLRLQRINWEYGSIVGIAVRPFLETVGQTSPANTDLVFPPVTSGRSPGAMQPAALAPTDDARLAFTVCGVR